MNFREKLDASAQEKTQENWPKVQQVFQEKIGPAALAVAKNDDQMGSVFKLAHEALPFPIRMFVKEDAFIQFCFSHRDNLLPKGEATSPGV